MRCFLAVPLAEPGLGDAQRVRGALVERVAGVRWARPETLHLTVHFFGRIDDARASEAVGVVAPIAARTVPFEVTLDRLGAFPPRGTPRVLWLGPTRDVIPLTSLALDCGAALARAGFEVEDRPYRAHCTLGRPRLPWDDAARAAWTAAIALPVEIRFSASRLVLYESHPGAAGAVYTERFSSPFEAR